MTLSLSSLFITLCVSIVLILILNIILTHEKSYFLFRADFLFILVLIISLRLFLPFEFRFTKTIPFPFIMNPLVSFMGYNLFQSIQVIHVLSCIWIIGILIGTGRYIQSLISTKKKINTITNHSVRYKMSELLENSVYPDFDVYVSSYVSSPIVFGFKDCILLPDMSFSKSELTNILLHESQHLKRHDILFKQISSILTIIYWWFPPVYWLRKNINFFVEIRADEKATEALDSYETLKYAETLVNIQKKISTPHDAVTNELCSYMIGEDQKTLSYRVNYLLNKQIKKKTNKALLCLIFLLPLFSNSIIFEPYFDESENLNGTLSGEELFNDGYLIEHKDGTYSLCLEGEISSIQDPEIFIESGIKIVKE